jgi:hypothetical protein
MSRLTSRAVDSRLNYSGAGFLASFFYFTRFSVPKNFEQKTLQQLTNFSLFPSSKEFQRKDVSYKSLQALFHSSVPKNFEKKDLNYKSLQVFFYSSLPRNFKKGRKLQELTNFSPFLCSEEFQRKDVSYKSLEALSYSSVPKNFEEKT